MNIFEWQTQKFILCNYLISKIAKAAFMERPQCGRTKVLRTWRDGWGKKYHAKSPLSVRERWAITTLADTE